MLEHNETTSRTFCPRSTFIVTDPCDLGRSRKSTLHGSLRAGSLVCLILLAGFSGSRYPTSVPARRLAQGSCVCDRHIPVTRSVTRGSHVGTLQPQRTLQAQDLPIIHLDRISNFFLQGRVFQSLFKDVRAHCYCASLVRTLFINHARATSFSSARPNSKTQQNTELRPVVQRLDNTIHWINHYPADSVVCFDNTCPLDGDLAGG